ncbi:hypothetical protein, partial [Burkholderia cenocepacia]
MSAREVNHALEAACHHALEKISAYPYCSHAAAARAHAKQAGRQLAMAGLDRADASPHVTANPPLHRDHHAGYVEAEKARFAVLYGGTGGLDTAGLDACLRARGARSGGPRARCRCRVCRDGCGLRDCG